VLAGLATNRNHIGREASETSFIRLGDKAAVLQKLLDHEHIKTTMKYVHVDHDMKQAASTALNAMYS